MDLFNIITNVRNSLDNWQQRFVFGIRLWNSSSQLWKLAPGEQNRYWNSIVD